MAQTPSAEDVAEGMRLFRTKDDCQSCHGWAADGRKMDTQMADGANLRTTRLNRDNLITAIKCGRPGKAMPAFDRLVYSDPLLRHEGGCPIRCGVQRSPETA